LTIAPFRDNPAKRLIREQWNTPLLKYIHEKYNVKYRYMGLPGMDLIDIRLWKDMIEEVIAFELRSPGTDSRKWIRTLRYNLKTFSFRSVAYLGSLEEVVIRGKDNEGNPYQQEKIITLYNLDFCDKIDSSVDTKDFGVKQWRYEAIRVLLNDQQRCFLEKVSSSPSYFILMLTIRNQMDATRLRQALNGQILAETQSYFSSCEKSNPIPPNGQVTGTHTWSIKAFLYDTLIGYFKAPNIATLWFPVIKYNGTPTRNKLGRLDDSPMFHWMILCKFGPQENPSPNCYPVSFLKKVNTLYATDSSISISSEPGEIPNRYQKLSPVAWFQDLEPIFVENGRMI